MAEIASAYTTEDDALVIVKGLTGGYRGQKPSGPSRKCWGAYRLGHARSSADSNRRAQRAAKSHQSSSTGKNIRRLIAKAQPPDKK
jgi:hypothetical protein